MEAQTAVFLPQMRFEGYYFATHAVLEARGAFKIASKAIPIYVPNIGIRGSAPRDLHSLRKILWISGS
jgi:hypothetical protein